MDGLFTTLSILLLKIISFGITRSLMPGTDLNYSTNVVGYYIRGYTVVIVGQTNHN